MDDYGQRRIFDKTVRIWDVLRSRSYVKIAKLKSKKIGEESGRKR